MYRFDGLDNKKCAAIGTMMRIGEKAGYLNMGGCPEAAELGCDDGIPESCDDYLVDLGAHSLALLHKKAKHCATDDTQVEQTNDEDVVDMS